jgi:hypothetical protein
MLRSLVGVDVVIFEEESVLDYRRRTLTFDSKNRTFAAVAIACEHSKFSPLPLTDAQRAEAAAEAEARAASGKQTEARPCTYFVQWGGAHASWYFGLLKGAIESYLVPRVRTAGSDACLALEKQLEEESAAVQQAS